MSECDWIRIWNLNLKAAFTSSPCVKVECLAVLAVALRVSGSHPGLVASGCKIVTRKSNLFSRGGQKKNTQKEGL